MNTALITGGAGFIGSNVVRLFLSKGYKVRVVDNLSTGHKKNIEDLDIEFYQGDIRDIELVRKASLDVDVVLHLAASVGRQKSLINPGEDAAVNLLGTTIVLEEARKAKINTFVYSSSAAIFGELQDAFVIEDHPQNPDSPYGVSKLAAEKQALCFASLYPMKVVCLRYFNVYGVNQRYDAYGNVIPIFAERLYNKKPLTIYGDGEQTRDFVNVKDVAMANFLSATVAKQSGVYNIGSGTNITINVLAKMMKEISGIDVPVEYAPIRPADVKHCRAEISKVQGDLGFQPDDDIKKGLTEYLNWFMEDIKISG